MKSQVALLAALISDELALYGYSPNRDIATVERRVMAEGNPFLTITMPRLETHLLSGLRDGVLPTIVGWGTHDRLPKFLKGLWQRVFSPNGVILANPCEASVASLRRILLFSKKYKEVCDPVYVDKATRELIQLERNYPKIDATALERLPRVLDVAFGGSIRQVMRGRLTDIAWISPKHGPGAVAERLNPVDKWNFSIIPDTLLDYVGHETFFPLWDDVSPTSGCVPARLIAVPKTATKPRLISAEPAYNQFVQQGIQTVLQEDFRRKEFICDFTSQTRNQLLSQIGSINGEFATIDLSEASDRLGIELCRLAFKRHPDFWRLLMACRSNFLDVGSETLCLKKFAPMGSAVTFPIQCMVFTCLVVMAVCEDADDWSDRKIREAVRDTGRYTVYGDDIIVPTHLYPEVVRLLTLSGLKVNSDKTFGKGSFRESCGADWMNGVNVTPVYLRYPLDAPLTASVVLSWVSTRNQLWLRYGPDSAVVGFLDGHLRKYTQVWRTAVPSYMPLDSGLYHSEPAGRWSSAFQRTRYRCIRVSNIYHRPAGSDRQRLCYYLSRITGGGSGDASAVGRPKASEIHLGWS